MVYRIAGFLCGFNFFFNAKNDKIPNMCAYYFDVEFYFPYRVTV